MLHAAATRRSLTLLVAILALAAQTLLAGASLSAKAAAPLRDAFGNVLCIGNEVQGDPGKHQTPGAHDCCLAACASGQILGPTPADRPAFANRAVFIDLGNFALPARSFDDPRRSKPGNPRAPPLSLS